MLSPELIRLAESGDSIRLTLRKLPSGELSLLLVAELAESDEKVPQDLHAIRERLATPILLKGTVEEFVNDSLAVHIGAIATAREAARSEISQAIKTITQAAEDAKAAAAAAKKKTPLKSPVKPAEKTAPAAPAAPAATDEVSSQSDDEDAFSAALSGKDSKGPAEVVAAPLMDDMFG